MGKGAISTAAPPSHGVTRETVWDSSTAMPFFFISRSSKRLISPVYGWQGKQTPLPFDDRHFRTEGAVDEGELTADNPAADNDQMFGHGLQLQRVIAGPGQADDPLAEKAAPAERTRWRE